MFIGLQTYIKIPEYPLYMVIENNSGKFFCGSRDGCLLVRELFLDILQSLFVGISVVECVQHLAENVIWRCCIE